MKHDAELSSHSVIFDELEDGCVVAGLLVAGQPCWFILGPFPTVPFVFATHQHAMRAVAFAMEAVLDEIDENLKALQEPEFWEDQAVGELDFEPIENASGMLLVKVIRRAKASDGFAFLVAESGDQDQDLAFDIAVFPDAETAKETTRLRQRQARP